MKPLSHASAKPSHYNKEAFSYDAFNENSSRVINQQIENFLKKYDVKTVLDLACGTGSQVFWLAKCGHEVMGADINLKMLKIARSKARKEKLPLKFVEGDMRTIEMGEFEAALTIFNAVGHLTKNDFELAMRNIYCNLQEGGLYLFDIFNLNYLLNGNNITKLTIDWQEMVGDTKIREIQYSAISEEGILASYDTYYKQIGNNKPQIIRSVQTLQVYTAKQLTEMLKNSGFEVLEQCNVDGSAFIDNKSERILTIARKRATN